MKNKGRSLLVTQTSRNEQKTYKVILNSSSGWFLLNQKRRVLCSKASYNFCLIIGLRIYGLQITRYKLGSQTRENIMIQASQVRTLSLTRDNLLQISKYLVHKRKSCSNKTSCITRQAATAKQAA